MEDVYKTHNPTVFVILGITGDLSRRKLIPALFHLHRKKMFPRLFQIVGFSRRAISDDALRAEVSQIARELPHADAASVQSFAKLFTYKQGVFEKRDGYDTLAQFLGRVDDEWRVCSNKLFYLAVPPEYYKKIFRNLADSGLTEPCGPEEGWTRVIVEKPFGKNLRTAEGLDALLGKLFHEEQIYRIDHYLGKETVQNILAFRFSNDFLAPAWDKKSIESIAVRIFEEQGVETRGDFYDSVGALRDVGQNHALQLLALFAMEKPESFTAEAIRTGRLKVLKSLRPPRNSEHLVRGQYEGYRAAAGVAAQTNTETYFRLVAELTAPRWRGVPIAIESGKKMAENKAEVVVVFRHSTPCFCPAASGKHYQNVLRYEIQPNEGIRLSFWVKRPGADLVIEEKDFSFNYRSAYSKELFVDAYEKLLLDAFTGNQTLFVSTDEIKASWKFTDAVIRSWKKNASPLILYKPGTVPQAS